jgi:hypothetical protein
MATIITHKLCISVENDNAVVIHLLFQGLEKLLQVSLEDVLQVVLRNGYDICASLLSIKRPKNTALNHRGLRDS